MLSNITFFMNFAVFDLLPLTLCIPCFFTFIFAVLFYRISARCHSTVWENLESGWKLGQLAISQIRLYWYFHCACAETVDYIIDWDIFSTFYHYTCAEMPYFHFQSKICYHHHRFKWCWFDVKTQKLFIVAIWQHDGQFLAIFSQRMCSGNLRFSSKILTSTFNLAAPIA